MNQTFDRLNADARKRMFAQEEKERMKILNEKEEEERIKREAKASKIIKALNIQCF